MGKTNLYKFSIEMVEIKQICPGTAEISNLGAFAGNLTQLSLAVIINFRILDMWNNNWSVGIVIFRIVL